MDDFSLQHEQNGNATVVSISGRVDSATSVTMDTELEKLISANKRVILDFKKVEFISSAGVRAIVKALKTAKKSITITLMHSTMTCFYSICSH